MIEPITNEEFLTRIKNGIKDYGVFLIAVVDADDKRSDMSTGFIYTIGHQERDRPDMIIVPMGEKDEILTPEEGQRRIRAASDLLQHIVNNWDISPAKNGDTAEDNLGRHYRIVLDTKQIFKEYTIQLSNYYGHNSYPLLALLPYNE